MEDAQPIAAAEQPSVSAGDLAPVSDDSVPPHDAAAAAAADVGESKPEDGAHDADADAAAAAATDVGESKPGAGAVDASYEAEAVQVNGSVAETMSYQTQGAVENGSMPNEVAGYPLDQHYEEAYSHEEERLWNLVRDNSLDFDAWTSLIDETEKVSQSNILKIRKVYDAFLDEFPLCFGYWKKYADHEGRLDSVEKVVEVYERAVSAVTYSVDIWLHYCVFTISTYDDPDTIRRLFERGLAYVGTDYLSYPLWDEYIRYEEAHQEWSHLSMIYTRILENPIQQLDRYFNCFKELATSRPLSEIRTAEEAVVIAATMETGPEGLEGEVRPDAVDQSSEPVSAGLTEAEELGKYIAIREEMYTKAKEFDSKIIGFETAIRRPYFHVKPLDDPELDNWHNYLDFIERGDDFNKVVKLYERCLIACANYPECWIRYVLCMKASGSMELALNALARASQVFVKKQPEIHLFAARFKEGNGDVSGARVEYQLIYSEISPLLLEAIVKHANMEYRLGDKEVACSVYETVISAEQAKEHSQILPLLVVQYSRFLSLVVGDPEKAREILYGSLEHMQVSKPLLEAVIHLESIQPSPKHVEKLDSMVDKYITPNSDNSIMASTTDREEISCIFMEFLDLFGDAQSIEKADNRHNMLFLRQKSASVSKKRRAEDFLASDKAKLIKSDTSVPTSAQSVMGAYPNAQNQWPAGYGQKAPTWPQTSQAQGQQWNPGYTQQGGYSAYGGYANYSTPQVPTPAPQSAAYAAYPAQAYPQQTYPQPAVAAAFPQQQTQAPQPYYTGYY